VRQSPRPAPALGAHFARFLASCAVAAALAVADAAQVVVRRRTADTSASSAESGRITTMSPRAWSAPYTPPQAACHELVPYPSRETADVWEGHFYACPRERAGILAGLLVPVAE
jgi:hypothetical protein